MNSLRIHVPAFVECDRPAAIPFETTADLLALDVVQRIKEPTHSHFAISDSLLMEISDNGYRWWVVGYLQHPEQVDLPKWDGGKYRARLADGREVTLTRDTELKVYSSCGGKLRLSDGSEAVDLRYPR